MNKRDTLLLVSAIPANRSLMRGVLAESYNLLESVNIQQARGLLRQNSVCIAAVVADISDCGDYGEFSAVSGELPLILLCREDSSDTLNLGFGAGASDVIALDYDPDAMLHRIDTIINLHNHKLYLEQMVADQGRKLRRSNDAMVGALSSIIEYRSAESGQHILRIRHFTKILLEEVRRTCPEYGLTDENISIIVSASALHDIGKIAIPDSILMKPGKLTEEEYAVMQTHAMTGCEILERLQDMGSEDYLRYAHNICHYHHERWDGRGYPEGLEGDAIPICAQVVGLADVYDALTSKRVYKEECSFESAVTMILNGECGIFSPRLLECFKNVLRPLRNLAQAYADGLSPQNESFDLTIPEPAVDESLDSLNLAQSKYLCLLHYLNCFVLEISVDLGHYHLRYNPYPELSLITQAVSLPQMARLVLDQLVVPEDRPRMERLIYGGIEEYLANGLRRQSFRFRFRGKNDQPETFDVTLLRANVNQTSNRSFAVLCRKLAQGEAGYVCSPEQPRNVPAFFGYTFCCRNDREFTLVDAMDTLTLAGYTPEEIRTRFSGKLLDLVHPEDREAVRTSVRGQLDQGVTVQQEFRAIYKDGTVHWFTCKGRLETRRDGVEALLCFLTDVSHLYQAHDALQTKLEHYEIILAQTENVLFEWDISGDNLTFSDTWEKIFGFRPPTDHARDTLTGSSFIHPDDLPLLLDAISSIEKGSGYEMVEARIATAAGRYLWCRFRASALRSLSGELEKICGIIINIDAEKQAERDLQERAERDNLTKLLNKETARKRTEEYLAQFPNGAHCALLILDLDNFKSVNDQYGHLFGDSVLKKTAQLIRKKFRSQDIIARIGGDEFLVVMRGVLDERLLDSRCRMLMEEICRFSQMQPQPLQLSCSIGIARSPEHGTSYLSLFRHADQALYRAKALGKNRHIFYSHQDPAVRGAGSRLTAVNHRIDSDSEPGLADDSLVRYAFQRLYSSDDVTAAVNEILALVGQKLNVSRVYIFENSDDNRFCANTYEWCNLGISSEIRNLQKVSYETDIPHYEDNFSESGIFYCLDIRELPQKAYEIASSQGIKSMLQCAMRENGAFRGFIGFDECITPRMWTREQIDMLCYFSEMLTVFLLKKREQEKALQTADELGRILDNQNAWIYTIDPDTFRITYRNQKVREQVPAAQLGTHCHRVIMGRDSPCPGCPAVGIRERKNSSSLMYSLSLELHLLADAALIQWKGRESCLMTCRKLSGSLTAAGLGSEPEA